jgi:sugar-specific transcriptional regulator TrmB
MGSKNAELEATVKDLRMKLETSMNREMRAVQNLQTARDNLRAQVTDAEKTVVHLTETVIPNMRDTAARAVGAKEEKIQELERKLAATTEAMLRERRRAERAELTKDHLAHVTVSRPIADQETLRRMEAGLHAVVTKADALAAETRDLLDELEQSKRSP